MDPAIAVEWALAALWMTFVLCGPALLAILVVGLVIGILQAATSVSESSVAFIPKLLVIGLVLLIVGPLSLSLFLDYLRDILMRIPELVN